MKMYCILFCALGVLAAVVPVDGSTLYGSTAAGGVAGELWVINASTGAALTDVGPLNDVTGKNYGVTGLAFDPVSGLLYGSTSGHSGTSLLAINPSTALVTVVGSYGTTGTMADIAFDASGNLYGISSSGGANLYSINISTGQATKVGASGFSVTAGGGLAISPAGVFYSTPEGNDLGTYDSTTGAYTAIATIATPAGSGTSYGALAFDGNTLYGMDLGSPTHLVTIDPTSGAVTDIGTSVANIDGIAFSVPEPGAGLLILGAGVIPFLSGIRRRRV